MAAKIIYVLTLLPVCLGIPGVVDLSQSLMDKARYPEIKGCYRIEALILTMQNPRGTTRNWMPCDLVPGSCNPKITGAIDYQTPNNDFGKDSVPYSRFSTLWDGGSTKNVDVNQIMSKDVCNHSTWKVNVRIRAVDKDVISDDSIDHWSCFIYTTDAPASSEQNAHWSDEKTCTGHNSAHKITWKYRWFYVPCSSCKEVAGSSGILRRYTPLIG
ncbi:uncharacterized protein LOC129583422 [Paramacrobiotus metropolitanus]|uniref:uncharacterized protein LOC129583422 n=1 Tax=Paramacrobiotus metropolitanus TaxID=2943436 RepID=UPI002445EE90|nr:uncharacterized protein LOC129583422 [Paramacrobiotus metropolitanus]